MIMATAGLVTLGGVWQESYADQIRIAKQESKAPQFFLEAGITDTRLDIFDSWLRLEEPEFIRWIENYTRSLGKEIDTITETILIKAPGEDARQEKLFRENPEVIATIKEPGKIIELINQDHWVIRYLRRHPEIFKSYQELLKRNLYRIILASALMDNSRAIRDNLIQYNKPAQLSFLYHDQLKIQGHLGATLPISFDLLEKLSKLEDRGIGEQEILDKIPNQWTPEIRLLTSSFLNGPKPDQVDLNFYVNVFIHELEHAIHQTGSDKKTIVNTGKYLNEGAIQNITLEIVQYLGQKELLLKPLIGFGTYDDRVILASILDGVTKANGGESFLMKWVSGIIDDGIFLDVLGSRFKDLNMDQGFIEILRKEITNPLSPSPFEASINLLKSLKINDVRISEKFFREVLMHGRVVDGWPLINLEKLFSRLR